MKDTLSSNDTSENKCILGDCLEKMKDIPDNSIDLIVTDLPYGIHNISWDKIIDYSLMFNEFFRITNGGIILFSSDYSLVSNNKKHFKYELIWKKSKSGSPLTAKFNPMKKHELIFVFSKNKQRIKYNPQMETGEPYKRDCSMGKVNNLKFGIKYVKTDNKGTRYPSSILDFPQQWRRQDQIHPTQKPVALFEYLIKTYTNKNDMVLDCCAGSGTTAIACLNTNRRYICIEKDEKYFEIMTKRISEHQSKLEGLSKE